MTLPVSEILLPSKRPNFNRLESAQKFMQIEVDVTCMYTNFGGHDFSSFGDTATIKNGQISPSDHGLHSPWSSKNLFDQNRLKKIHANRG